MNAGNDLNKSNRRDESSVAASEASPSQRATFLTDRLSMTYAEAIEFAEGSESEVWKSVARILRRRASRASGVTN